MTQPSYLTGRRNVHDSPWTAARDALLAELWLAGYSAGQIAKQITDVVVTRCAVIGRAHRLKLPPRQPRKRDIRPRPRAPRVQIWKPKPKPKPLPPVAPSLPQTRGLSLLELELTSCRWPIGEGPFLFCGADAAEGEVYCPFHRRMARVRERKE